MLQIVIASKLIGVAMIMVAPEKSKIFLDLLGAVQEACMVIVRWVMRIAPIAVFGLLAQITSRIGIEVIFGLAMYVVTVLNVCCDGPNWVNRSSPLLFVTGGIRCKAISGRFSPHSEKRDAARIFDIIVGCGPASFAKDGRGEISGTGIDSPLRRPVGDND